jgi:hypothetical protein
VFDRAIAGGSDGRVGTDGDVIDKCYQKAMAKKQLFFAVQNDDDCYTFSDDKYDKHGPESNCVDDIGRFNSISVYEIGRLHSDIFM